LEIISCYKKWMNLSNVQFSMTDNIKLQRNNNICDWQLKRSLMVHAFY
jgi:hypothetical protein